MLPAVGLLLAILAPAEVQRLQAYESAWSDSNARQQFEQRARAEFGGRGVEIADRFLRYNDARPRNDAYFFVLRAVGDAETALVLIRALPHPPPHESGFLDRHFGEISTAVEAVLEGQSQTAGDPRIVTALQEAIGVSRRKPNGVGAEEALESLRLIGYCRSAEAERALAGLSSDPDARFRTAAAAALAQLAALPRDRVTLEPSVPSSRPPSSGGGGVSDRAAGGVIAAPPVSPLPPRSTSPLLRILSSDPSAAARTQAAVSLGFLDGEDAVPALQAALSTERDPRVIDAFVSSLRQLGRPIGEPARCRNLIGRTWEAAIAQQMLECWYRQQGTPNQLMEMAIEGAPTQRAVALSALSYPRNVRPQLVVDLSRRPPTFDPAVRERLMDAAVWTLSQDGAISGSTRALTEEALWNISGRDMALSLEHLDRVTPGQARFGASAALARADAAAYDARRRRQQALLGAAIAIGFAIAALVIVRWRRPALLFAGSALLWVLWTLQAHGVRDLPPPPLSLLTVAAIGIFSAGVATAGMALVAGGARLGFRRAAIKSVGTVLAAALLGGAVCAQTRSARLFPTDMEGWELIFDPIGSAILAMAAAVALLVADRTMSAMLADRTGA